MELDDMRTAWAALDAKLDTVLRLDRAAVRAIALRPARSALQRIALSLIFEAACTFAVVASLGASLAERVHAPELLAATIALDVYAIAVFAALVRNLVDLRGVDVTAPVLAIAERFERFRLTRSRTIRAILVTAPLAWVPLSIVALDAFGIDAAATFGVAYLAANAVFGCAVILVAAIVAKRRPALLSGSRLGRSLARTLSGESVRAAERALRDVATFEAS